jgi:hypothetical protein
MGRTYNTNVGEEVCIEYICGKATRNETTGKTKT